MDSYPSKKTVCISYEQHQCQKAVDFYWVFFRVPVPRGLTLNEQDINYKHTAQHTDKHTENTKKNEIWKKTTTIFIQIDTNTMTSTRKIQKHMEWKKDDNNFYTNGHDYITCTRKIQKQMEYGKMTTTIFFLYEWTRRQLQIHGKYKTSREIQNQMRVKVNACESLELSSSLVAMVKI